MHTIGDLLYFDIVWYTATSFRITLLSVGQYSLSCKTYYRQISWILEAARLFYNDHIALKCDRHLGSAAAEMPVKFQSDWKSLNPNLATSSLHEILW